MNSNLFVFLLIGMMASHAHAVSTRLQIFTTKANDHYIQIQSCHPSEQDKENGYGNVVVVAECEGPYPRGVCRPAHKLGRYDVYQVMSVYKKLNIPQPTTALKFDFVPLKSQNANECPDKRVCWSQQDGIEFTVLPGELLEHFRELYLWNYEIVEEALKQKLIEKNHPVADCASS